MMAVRAAVLVAMLAACSEEDQPPIEVTVEVMTINLRHDENEWERRFALIADEIVRLDPDLVGLQEIEITDVDQTSALLDLVADRGGASYEFHESLKWPPYGALTGEGIGILSRYPILETDVRNLLEGGRVAVWTRVEVEPGYTVDFFNTHLDSGAVPGMTGDEVNIQQAELTLAFIAEKEPESHVAFLTGDMNATDERTSYQLFTDSGLVDTYREVHGEDTDVTGNTSPIVLMEGAEQAPVRRIDYVFAGPPPEDALVTTTDSIICFQNHDEAGFYPSDHLGVMTTLDLVVPHE